MSPASRLAQIELDQKLRQGEQEQQGSGGSTGLVFQLEEEERPSDELRAANIDFRVRSYALSFIN